MTRSHLSHAFRLIIGIFTAFIVLNIGVASASSDSSGAVYILTNSPNGNAVMSWNRAADGALTLAGSYSTGGTGTGTGLGSQGALILSENHQWLFAVNAGSNDISVFRVRHERLVLTQRVPSGGLRPTSLTVHKDLLYVLNADGAGNITGFSGAQHGQLAPIANSTRPLSGSATAAAQVQFSPDGDALVVTERATQTIDTYRVGKNGLATGPIVNHSAGAVPFGFAFGKRNQLVVSEAGGGQNGLSAASSYVLKDNGTLTVRSASAQTFQGAACWVVVTKNGRYAYTANAAASSNSISGFRISEHGNLTLLTPDGRTGLTGDGPTDMALSNNSLFLYVRNARGNSISAFAVQADGSLQALPGASGLPAGAAGLAAY
jgi:6-phosphogluconolactonase (cycloisomerase 2 family)